MSTIDAAIIKALVEHVGGDSSGIPDGTIGGGTTYTAGNGIEISDENVISVADHQHTNLTTLTIKQGLTASTITTNLISCVDENQGITLSANRVNITYLYKVRHSGAELPSFRTLWIFRRKTHPRR